MEFDKQPQEDEATMQLSTPTTIQSSYGGRSSYIGSILALSAYYDDDDEQNTDELPFAVENRTNNSLSFPVKNLHPGRASRGINQDNSETKSSLGQDEGGIVIVSPDEDENDDIHWDSSHNRLVHHSEHEPLDSVIMAAAAQVDTQREGGDSFEKLMQQAESRCHEDNLEVEGVSKQKSFWSRFQRSQSSSEPIANQPAIDQSLQHSSRPPIRTAQIAPNKFVVEVEILPNSNNRTNTRDAIDILANIDLLYLWFDPIPAVFESTIKDGSGTYSPVNSNSSQSENGQRHRDGEWIEICTPPLILPKDSKISTVLRFLQVKLRSAIGFPPRIRSTILIERSAGRMGMTIGPYPDGMTAFHNFNVRMQNDCIVISDEVQLDRSGEEGTSYHFYCFCRIASGLFKVLQWTLIRWYQPDLASYMSQTSTSMEKLRMLIYKGEEGAYALEDSECGCLEEGGDLISAPLLLA